jgi:hypothetical protein
MVTANRQTLRDRLGELAAEIEELSSGLDRELRREVQRRLRRVAERGGTMSYRLDTAMPAEAVARLDAWLADTSGGVRTVTWLAQKCGVTPQHLRECIRGTRAMTPRVAGLLAEVTGIPAAELMPLDDRPAVAS